MSETVYRNIEQADAKSAAALEKECLDTAWTEDQIKNLPQQAFYMGAFCENTLCGVLSAYFVADEVQIMNLAVSDNFRRKGIAFGLMSELLTQAKEKNCCFITLEVAENNIGAIKLYEKCGFSAVGKRNGFYGDIAAIIMEKSL
ncbi:MAG: GNAT family N-acetyltransferase [Ruminococcaceae bacterium]|nr:GNAT family N-acetyltransferase [Oscillospiraceae bacterium]